MNGIFFFEYYFGIVYFGFSLVETLCLRIVKIVVGKMCFFKLVYIDSDCIVSENIYIFFREVFFGLNLLRY